ncbi:hypothetical protein GA0115250_12441, partial [Streptomyces sp. BvitLS-983]
MHGPTPSGPRPSRRALLRGAAGRRP